MAQGLPVKRLYVSANRDTTDNNGLVGAGGVPTDDTTVNLPIDWQNQEAQSNLAAIQSQQSQFLPTLQAIGSNIYNTITGSNQAPVNTTTTSATTNDNSVQNIVDQLLGTGGQERYILWPEKIIRDAINAPHDVMTSKTPLRSEDLIKPAMDISALAGSGGLAGAEEGASLGSAPFLRPALKYQGKIYKAPIGAEHMDAIPESLRPEFTRQAMSGEDISNFNFGFMNHKGQFLNREDALKYAIDNGLLSPHDAKFGALTSTLMSDTNQPGAAIGALEKSQSPFYSALEKGVADISQNKMTGDQWLGTLTNKPGVKPEEMDWTGLKDYLEANKDQPISKADIQQHLANNKMQVNDVVKGFGSFDKQRLAELDNKLKQNGKLEGNEIEEYNNLLDRENFKNTGKNATKYSSYQLPGGPLSRDTEILTNKGWKRIDTIEVGDIVMTRKDDDGLLEWQPVLDVPKVYAENLYHFFSQSVNMRVTENHQMIVKKYRRNEKGIFRLSAKELWNTSECVIPLTGNWNGNGNDTIFGFNANDLAELFGWYLAEGSCKLSSNGGKNTIQIAQCREHNPENCDRIEALLNRMNLPWRYYGQAYGIGIKTINKDLVELFHEQPLSEFKFIPYFFFNQSKSVIQSLLDGLILGDGHTSIQDNRLNKTTFFTKSEQLAGDVQILILMTGKCATVRQRPSGLYCVGIKYKEWSSVDDAKFEIAPYNDFAFCVTVENHAIYVRRFGVAAFTGNSNYREHLLTLPSRLPEERINFYKSKGYTPEDARTMANKESATGDFKSSHWDEPNVLAHVRTNERDVAGKPSLHIEEIQSDWHQQGRNKGYQNSERYEELNNKYRGGRATPDEIKEMNNLQTAKAQGVPNAPFKTSWPELAMKRMIRLAAEEGKDRISWTPGEAQAARYDLSKQVSKIEYNEKHSVLDMYDKNGKYLGAKSVKPEKLPDHIGKEAADKLLNNPTNQIKTNDGSVKKELSGLDLKIGGEGMKGFYDQMLPKMVEKLGKKYGVKVKEGKVGKSLDDVLKDKNMTKQEFENLSLSGRNKILENVNEQKPVYYFDIPEKMKQDVLRKGFPLFSNTSYSAPLAALENSPKLEQIPWNKNPDIGWWKDQGNNYTLYHGTHKR